MFGIKLIKTTMTAALLLAIGGCSTAPKIQEFAETASPADEVQRLASALQSARDHQVDVLSPSTFKEADEEFKSAVKSHQSGKDGKDVLHQVALGNAHLDRANHFSEVARTNMEDVVMARQAALAAQA